MPEFTPTEEITWKTYSVIPAPETTTIQHPSWYEPWGSVMEVVVVVQTWSTVPNPSFYRFMSSALSTDALSSGIAPGPSSNSSVELHTTSPSSAVSVDESATPTISPGAAAGIAVGSIIFGLIVGGLAALFLLRRKPHRRPQPEFLPMQYDGREKSLPTAPLGDRLHLEQFLLDSNPDSEIVSEFRSLGHLTQSHVEDHYHLRPVQRNVNTLTQLLADLGLGQGAILTPESLASLALDPRTRFVALQHIISRVTFQSATLNNSSPISLLPPVAKALTQNMPPIEEHRGSPEGTLTW
jgi:hypothetical protein